MGLKQQALHREVSAVGRSALGELRCVLGLVCLKVGVEVDPSAVALLRPIKEMSSESIAFSCSEHATHTRTLSSYAEGAGG